MAMLPMKGNNVIKLESVAFRSYSGNTQGVWADATVTLNGHRVVKIGSKDSAFTAYCMFYDANGSRLENNTIPNAGATYTIPAGAVKVVFRCAYTGATGGTLYYIRNIEIY